VSVKIVKRNASDVRVQWKVEHPVVDADWDGFRSALLKKSKTNAVERERFTSIFNSDSIAFRKALKPFWNRHITSFRRSSDNPVYAVTPTLYEFSMLPTLALLRDSLTPEPSAIEHFFDEDSTGFDDLMTNINADLGAYSRGVFQELLAKLGTKRVKSSEMSAVLGHPNINFFCNDCGKSFQGPAVLGASHTCTLWTVVSGLHYAALGDYYTSEAFTAAYDEGMASDPDRHHYWAEMPFRTLSRIRVDKDAVADANRILALLTSCGIQTPEPVTMESLETTTESLTFVCDVCERFDDKRFDGRYKGASAMVSQNISYNDMCLDL
jgi:hypothetical protein